MTRVIGTTIPHEQNSQLLSTNPLGDLLTFKEAMSYLRVSRSTLYRLMWIGQLTGHKVGSTWRFYREDLRACIQTPEALQTSNARTEAERQAAR
jgi:excisionase family DNA binding protein